MVWPLDNHQPSQSSMLFILQTRACNCIRPIGTSSTTIQQVRIQADVIQDYCCGITDLFDWWWGRLGHLHRSKVLNTKVVMVELLCKVVTIVAVWREGERGRNFVVMLYLLQ